jgi:hypothetical protein
VVFILAAALPLQAYEWASRYDGPAGGADEAAAIAISCA